MRRIYYSGDINAECGGYFFSLTTWGYDYVDVVRITPCSDAGGPDNCFWVQALTALIPDKGSEKEKRALETCGWFDNDEYTKAEGVAKKSMLLDAVLSYGYYDPHNTMRRHWSQLIQIGKVQSEFNPREGEFKPDIVLRDGARIANYARKVFKELYE